MLTAWRRFDAPSRRCRLHQSAVALHQLIQFHVIFPLGEEQFAQSPVSACQNCDAGKPVSLPIDRPAARSRRSPIRSLAPAHSRSFLSS
jgi:hypothetical protein